MQAPRRSGLYSASALVITVVLAGACGDGDGGVPGDSTTPPDGGMGGSATGSGGGGFGGGGGAPPEPEQYVPCVGDNCWQAPQLPAYCGLAAVDENFGTGLYNVHEFPLAAPADVELELSLEATGGTWNPALLIRDESGTILHDGEIAAADETVSGELITSGRDSGTAAVRITASDDMPLYVFATSWGVVDSGFADPMPADATYQLTVAGNCDPGPIEIISPPNFDAGDVAGGYYLLPPSEPPGLYTRKGEACSRGNALLIDVLYTVAWHWHQRRPALSPIAMRDLNENIPACGTDHATHDDGTHADMVIDCATDVSCADKAPVIELAKLIIDTGQACGIINDNDSAVLDEVNAYFDSQYSYEPWWGTFMRSVGGHTHHLHIRVKKPDGTCN